MTRHRIKTSHANLSPATAKALNKQQILQTIDDICNYTNVVLETLLTAASDKYYLGDAMDQVRESMGKHLGDWINYYQSPPESESD